MVFPGISITDFIKFFLCPNEQKGEHRKKAPFSATLSIAGSKSLDFLETIYI